MYADVIFSAVRSGTQTGDQLAVKNGER